MKNPSLKNALDHLREVEQYINFLEKENERLIKVNEDLRKMRSVVVSDFRNE